MKIIIPKIVIGGGPSSARQAIYVVLIAALGWLTPKVLESGWKAAFPEDGKNFTTPRASLERCNREALASFRERWEAAAGARNGTAAALGRWWHRSEAFEPKTP